MDSTIDVVAAWRLATDAFAVRLDATGPTELDNDTPCDDWSVRDLVAHVFDVQTRAPRALGADVAAGADHGAAAWRELTAGIDTIISEPGRLEEQVISGLGPMAASDMLHIALADCLTHTWDLSRAIDADDTLPEEAAVVALAFMRPLDELLRGAGMLGPKVDPPAGASTATQLICFAGREPDWRPSAS